MLNRADEGAKETGLIITAPKGAAHLVLNSKSDGYCYKVLFASHDNYADYNLNINLTGLHDMEWEYQNWVYPQCVSLFRYRNQLYWDFCTGDTPRNYSGVASYDFDTHEIHKTILKKNPTKDDHSLIAVLPLSNGRILCAYTEGHSEGKYIFVRISAQQESIDRFEDAIPIAFEYDPSYVQLFEYNGKLYMFTREIIEWPSHFRWSYKTSTDFGETWGKEHVFIVADMQYYIQLTETATPGTLLLCCYSNPQFDQTDIRAGYLHLSDMALYQTDDSTLIGTDNISYTNVPIMVTCPSGKKLRLYNGAKSTVGDVKILYCEMTIGSPNNGVYKLCDNGENYTIADAGMDLLNRYGTAAADANAQLGVAWINTTQIVVGRGYEGRDLIEIYDYDGAGHFTLNRVVADGDRTNDVRVARPMVDSTNQKALVYWRGYFNPATYTDFFTDGRIELLTPEQ